MTRLARIDRLDERFPRPPDPTMWDMSRWTDDEVDEMWGYSEKMRMVAAAEQYLRWLEPLMTRPVPVTADDSPYAHHPVLRTLSLGIRTHIADQLAVGRRIAAIKTVRDNVSGLALRDAKTFVDALEYWWHL